MWWLFDNGSWECSQNGKYDIERNYFDSSVGKTLGMRQDMMR